MMPPGGSAAASEALAELGVLQHQILTDKKSGPMAAGGPPAGPSTTSSRPICGRCSVSTIRPRCYRRAWWRQKSLAGSRCEHAWRSQRPANDWAGFADNLREVVKLSRQEAQIRADARGGSRHDALLDIFEPDMTSARLDSLFADLKSWLPSLLRQAVAKQATQTLLAPQGLSRLPLSASWACRPCVSSALTSTAGASTSALTRSAAASPRMCASPPATTKTTCSAPCSA